MKDGDRIDAPLRWRGTCGDASITTMLEDGRTVCLRTVAPADEGLLREGIARMSPHSRYLRFFSGAASPPDWVIDRLLDADGVLHLAWGAIDTSIPEHPAIGVVHAMRPDADAQIAEFSIAVIDDYHGLGLGRLLSATLLLDAAGDGMDLLTAHVLAENRAAIDFVRKLGGHVVGQDGPTIEYRFEVADALERLRRETDPPGLTDVFSHFDALNRA